EPRDVEQPAHRLARRAECEPALAVGEPALRGEDRAEPGRIEEPRPGEVEDELRDVIGEQAGGLLFEAWCGVGVELALDRYDGSSSGTIRRQRQVRAHRVVFHIPSSCWSAYYGQPTAMLPGSNSLGTAVRRSRIFACTETVGPFPYHFARRLVGADTQEGGMTDVARGRPFGEANLHDERGIDEPHALWNATGAERAVVARGRGEPLSEVGDDRTRQPAADLARVVQNVAVVVADAQRSDTAGPALLTRLPAADDELLAELVLDLDPRARSSPELVARVEA